MNVKI